MTHRHISLQLYINYNQNLSKSVVKVKLAVMRLIYGIATRIGLGDQISEALNGAFVPPGVDDYDYGEGFGLGDQDDYDY
ncbi:uncharacterized protein isoform X2 [Leptinotarsa decemlineata]|uniref:uncharacterized protein isoform X2 n=1 Tax=Leptinotarsa decemlineata TaxID=7539 RepID=UPI003D307301